MDNEIKITENAISFAKKNKERIAKELTDITRYKPDLVPISVFMAGSPGAGKTEFSKNLVESLENDHSENNAIGNVVRIDPDDIRPYFQDYNGKNSKLFHGAVSLVVEKIHDNVLHNNQSFIFDSTLSKYDKAIENIDRSLSKKRAVFVMYVYQKPEIAWNFTKAREEEEGRNIPKNSFIDQFFGSREVVNKIIKKYGDKINIYLIQKNFDNFSEKFFIIKSKNEQIDDYIEGVYNREDLEKNL